MNNTRSQELLGYYGPYLERGGVHGQEMVEKLLQDPELPLSEEELEVAYAFSGQVFNNAVVDGKSVETILRAQQDEVSAAPFFFPQAFIEGRVMFPEHVTAPAFISADEVYAWIATCIEDESLTPDELRKIAKQSGECYRDEMAHALVSDEPLESSWSDLQAFVVNPTEFITSTRDIVAVRQYLLGLRRDHKRRWRPARRCEACTYRCVSCTGK